MNSTGAAIGNLSRNWMISPRNTTMSMHSILSISQGHDLQCFKTEQFQFSAGWWAVLNICLVYLSVVILFGVVFFFTLPRGQTQIYNVSITSQDYHATLRLEMEPPLRPVRVNMLCQLPDQRDISILYEIEERQVIYRADSQDWCYVRTTTGPQFQEETSTFRSIVLGENAFDSIDLKPEIHLLQFPHPMTSKQQQRHLNEAVRKFCKEHQTFWLTHFDEEQEHSYFPLKQSSAKRRRQSISNVQLIDACFQSLVIYESSY